MRVVPALDELEDRHASLLVRGEALAVYELTLECGKVVDPGLSHCRQGKEL